MSRAGRRACPYCGARVARGARRCRRCHMECAARPPWIWAYALGAVVTAVLFPLMAEGASASEGVGSAVFPLADLLACAAFAVATTVLLVAWILRARRLARQRQPGLSSPVDEWAASSGRQP